MAGRRGNGGPDSGNIDWSNFDLRQLVGAGTPRTPRPPTRRGISLSVLVLLLLLLPIILGPLVGFLTDLLWFRSLGLEDVYLRRYTAGFWAFIVFFLLFFVLAVPNLYLALRPQVPHVVVEAGRPRSSALRMTLRVMWLLLIPAFFFGLAGSAQWDVLLRWLNAVPFGASDPVFGRDIGFYFFTLPVLDFVRGWAIAAVLAIAIGVVLLYVLRGVIGVATDTVARADIAVAGRTALALARPARAHLSVLGGVFLALIAFGYVIGEIVSLATNRKAGPPLQATAVGGVRVLLDDSRFVQPAEPVGQDVRGNPLARGKKLVERVPALEHQVAHDQQRPGIAQQVQRDADRAPGSAPSSSTHSSRRIHTHLHYAI